jgi:hypothetical protein
MYSLIGYRNTERVFVERAFYHTKQAAEEAGARYVRHGFLTDYLVF